MAGQIEGDHAPLAAQGRVRHQRVVLARIGAGGVQHQQRRAIRQPAGFIVEGGGHRAQVQVGVMAGDGAAVKQGGAGVDLAPQDLEQPFQGMQGLGDGQGIALDAQALGLALRGGERVVAGGGHGIQQLAPGVGRRADDEALRGGGGLARPGRNPVSRIRAGLQPDGARQAPGCGDEFAILLRQGRRGPQFLDDRLHLRMPPLVGA
ncbi:hypothetical protein [Achromobacter xylosoxidans]|uniref:hypothetical protein n=1 Tax=Alcaligenes xylosoxydans xylosoxydans TaxID=85698 RepID=UPI001F5BE783|nr:hypothetical protein [Achromobacter xylosoxidans]